MQLAAGEIRPDEDGRLPTTLTSAARAYVIWQQTDLAPYAGGTFAWPPEFLDDYLLFHFVFVSNRPEPGEPSDRDLRKMTRRR